MVTKKRPIRKKTKKELADPQFKRRQRREFQVNVAMFAICKRLPKKRVDFILNMASGAYMTRRFFAETDEAAQRKEHRRWDKLRREFLRDATNPLELHVFGAHWNWEVHPGPALQIINNPNCDAGTALWLYWNNDPYYYTEFRRIGDCEEYNQGSFQIMRAIERRFRRNDFASFTISFDPEPFIDAEMEEAEWVVRKIPKFMYQPVVPRRSRKRR